MMLMDASDGTHQKLEAALANLQPLRDLAKNWDVDIASYLEDYLQDIVGLDPETAAGAASLFSSDGTPNFSQAALLLQNSTNVYGRKVEYLYALVYAALDDLVASSAHAKQQKTKGTDAEIDDFEAFDTEFQFLLLDDVLPTDKTEGGDKINLKESALDRHGAELNNSLVSLVSRPSMSGTRFSLGGLSVTKMDASALQHGNMAAAVRTLMSTLNREGGDAGGSNLRLLSDRSDVNHSGILHLPGTAIHASNQNGPRHSHIGAVMMNPSHAEGLSPMEVDDEVGGLYYADGDENDGPGFDMNDEINLSRKFEETTEKSKSVQFKASAKHSKADPWDLLDPHDTESVTGRSLKVGITYKLPCGLVEPPSQCVTGASTKRKHEPRFQEQPAIKENMCIAAATFKAIMANDRRRREQEGNSRNEGDTALSEDYNASVEDYVLQRPIVPVKGLIFGHEFAYIAKAEAKRRVAERRLRRKVVAENPSALPEKEANNLLGYDDHDDNGEDFDFGGGDDGSFGGGEDVDNDKAAMGNTGMVSLDHVYLTSEHDSTSPDATAFEALCRAHIRAFARGADKYAAETNLTKRVGKWQSKLAPILEEEERRPEFDIYKYGEKVISGVQLEILKRAADTKLSREPKASQLINFHAITRNCERYEVCRLFLASLSLSNSGNIMLTSEAGKVMTPDSLQIQLLDANVESPMENYLAPSATEIDVAIRSVS